MGPPLSVASLLLVFLIVPPLAAADVQFDADALANVESITLLPILFPAELDLDTQGRAADKAYNELRRHLALKGYVLDRPRNWIPPQDWSYAKLAQMTPREIAELAPDSSEHFAVGFIHSLEMSSWVIASSAEASLAVKLINKKTGAVVWQNETKGRYAESLFNTGLVVMGITKDDLWAVWNALVDLFEDLPEKEY